MLRYSLPIVLVIWFFPPALRYKIDCLAFLEIGVSESLISPIIAGKKSITSDTALRLSKYFNTTPDFWLNYQRAFDLEELEKQNQKAYNKIKPLVFNMPSYLVTA